MTLSICFIILLCLPLFPCLSLSAIAPLSSLYSGSKNCPNVYMFWNDWSVVAYWLKQHFWVFQTKYYSILAFQKIQNHVIWMETHWVISQTKCLLIGTVFWPSIILHIFQFKGQNKCLNGVQSCLNHVCEFICIIFGYWHPLYHILSNNCWCQDYLYYKVCLNGF